MTRFELVLQYTHDLQDEIFAEIMKRVIEDNFHNDDDMPKIVLTLALGLMIDMFTRMRRNYPDHFADVYPSIMEEIITELEKLRP